MSLQAVGGSSLLTGSTTYTLKNQDKQELKEHYLKIFKKAQEPCSSEKEEQRKILVYHGVLFFLSYPELIGQDGYSESCKIEELLHRVTLFCQQKGLFYSSNATPEDALKSSESIKAYFLFNSWLCVSLYTHESTSRENNDINLTDPLKQLPILSESALKIFMKYMASGTMELTMDVAPDLLILSYLWNLVDLKAECEKYLTDHLITEEDPSAEIQTFFQRAKVVFCSLAHMKIAQSFTLKKAHLLGEKEYAFLARLITKLCQYPKLFCRPEEGGICTQEERDRLTVFFRDSGLFKYLYLQQEEQEFHDITFYNNKEGGEHERMQMDEGTEPVWEERTHSIFYLLQSPLLRASLMRGMKESWSRRIKVNLSRSTVCVTIPNYIISGEIDTFKDVWNLIYFSGEWEINHLKKTCEKEYSVSIGNQLLQEDDIRNAKATGAYYLRGLFLDGLLRAVGEGSYKLYCNQTEIKEKFNGNPDNWISYLEKSPEKITVCISNLFLLKVDTDGKYFDALLLLLEYYDDLTFSWGSASTDLLSDILCNNIEISCSRSSANKEQFDKLMELILKHIANNLWKFLESDSSFDGFLNLPYIINRYSSLLKIRRTSSSKVDFEKKARMQIFKKIRASYPLDRIKEIKEKVELQILETKNLADKRYDEKMEKIRTEITSVSQKISWATHRIKECAHVFDLLEQNLQKNIFRSEYPFNIWNFLQYLQSSETKEDTPSFIPNNVIRDLEDFKSEHPECSLFWENILMPLSKKALSHAKKKAFEKMVFDYDYLSNPPNFSRAVNDPNGSLASDLVILYFRAFYDHLKDNVKAKGAIFSEQKDKDNKRLRHLIKKEERLKRISTNLSKKHELVVDKWERKRELLNEILALQNKSARRSGKGSKLKTEKTSRKRKSPPT